MSIMPFKITIIKKIILNIYMTFKKMNNKCNLTGLQIYLNNNKG